MKNFIILGCVNLQLFAGNLNTNLSTDNTSGNDLSPGMRTFYSDHLIEVASAKLVHDQFGQKHPIPKNGGKRIEFRKYQPLPKLLTPLQEGVTPDGQKMDMANVVAEVKQYGGYIALSDWLELTHIDNTMVQATKLIGSQAGRTLDTITREIINAGTSVQYSDSLNLNGRHLLSGGNENDEDNHYLSVKAIQLATRYLKTQNANPIDDSFVAIIHPDIAFDIMNDKRWIDVKQYSDPEGIYEGEIGKIAGVRFVETTEAKIFTAKDLSAANRELTVSGFDASKNTVTVNEALTAEDAAALAGREILIGVAKYTVVSATGSVITLKETISNIEEGTVIYPGEAGAKGRAVYSTLILGADAYGTTEITGGGLEFITHQKGSAGSADALNQRATVGWKASKTAEILVEQYMVRVETTSTFDEKAN